MARVVRNADVSVLEAQVAALQELLSVQEKVTIEQSVRLEQARIAAERLNEQLQEVAATARDMAREAAIASAAKGEFLANMSHEIRTPMTSILGYADLLMDPSIGPSDRLNYLAIIRRNGDYLLTLINDILDLSKIEAGKMTMAVRPCSLVSLIADIASIMRARAQQRGIDLAIEYATELPATIQTDDSRFRQILVNLVGNAIKFTERGKVDLLVSYLPDWKDTGPGVCIKMADTGIGIEEARLPSLFEPFTQADASTSRRYGGTGLGLAISRRLSSLLGGELTVVSRAGRGSVFTLVLPAGSAAGVRMLSKPMEATTAELVGAAPSPVNSETLEGLRILLAEDGPDNQRLIGTVLRKAGAEVQIADNGRVALETVQARGLTGFDVILMDMQMPEMDGYQATRALRNLGWTRPILALTAHAMAGDREKSLEAGCEDHLIKPIDRGALVRAVAEHAGRRTDAKSPGREESAQRLEFDAEPLRSELADDPELAEILDEFVRGLPDKLGAMQEALANGNVPDLQRLAHQLKGSGGGYGYPRLTALGKTLEDAAKAGGLEMAKLILHELTNLCEAIARGRANALVSTEASL